MAFGLLNSKVAKTIAANAPRYRKIIEPFGDGGTFALFLEKRRPKEHVVNFEDEVMFALMLFIQNLSARDKAALKRFDWTGTEEAFDKALAVSATEGPELFYRYFYLKEFGTMSKDPEAPPVFDWMRRGENMKSMLFDLPIMKIGLKGVTLINSDPMALVSSGGTDSFLILLPQTPEQIQAVESRLGSISSPFFYAKKIASNEQLVEDAASGSDRIVISEFSAASIMMAMMEARTNYENDLMPIAPDPDDSKNSMQM